MKIAIPVEQNQIQTVISASFGRAPYYLIHNTETNQNEFLDNSALLSQGGAGIKAAQILLDQNVDVLIAPRCGENAALLLREGGVSLYKNNCEQPEKLIQSLKQSQLELLIDIHAGFHNHQ